MEDAALEIHGLRIYLSVRDAREDGEEENVRDELRDHAPHVPVEPQGRPEGLQPSRGHGGEAAGLGVRVIIIRVGISISCIC